jgi:dTDP-4-amino-4,6-dideoxygalactose transaminase
LIKILESDFDEAIAIADFVRDGWLTNGPKTLEFESLLSEIIAVNKEQVMAVSSVASM